MRVICLNCCTLNFTAAQKWDAPNKTLTHLSGQAGSRFEGHKRSLAFTLILLCPSTNASVKLSLNLPEAFCLGNKSPLWTPGLMLMPLFKMTDVNDLIDTVIPKASAFHYFYIGNLYITTLTASVCAPFQVCTSDRWGCCRRCTDTCRLWPFQVLHELNRAAVMWGTSSADVKLLYYARLINCDSKTNWYGQLNDFKVLK